MMLCWYYGIAPAIVTRCCLNQLSTLIKETQKFIAEYVRLPRVITKFKILLRQRLLIQENPRQFLEEELLDYTAKH
ncbi:unnamed protein product, partial [Iphiclides podalirius]